MMVLTGPLPNPMANQKDIGGTSSSRGERTAIPIHALFNRYMEGDRNAIECCCVTISLNSIYIMWTNGRRLHYTTQWTRLVSVIVHLFVIRKERKWVDEDYVK